MSVRGIGATRTGLSCLGDRCVSIWSITRDHGVLLVLHPGPCHRRGTCHVYLSQTHVKVPYSQAGGLACVFTCVCVVYVCRWCVVGVSIGGSAQARRLRCRFLYSSTWRSTLAPKGAQRATSGVKHRPTTRDPARPSVADGLRFFLRAPLSQGSTHAYAPAAPLTIVEGFSERILR